MKTTAADELPISGLNIDDRRTRRQGGDSSTNSKTSKRSSGTHNTRNSRLSSKLNSKSSRTSKILDTAKRSNVSKSKITDEDSILEKATRLQTRRASSKASKQSKGTPSSARASKTNTAIREGAYINNAITENTELPIPTAIFTPIQDKGKFTTAGNKRYSLFIAPKFQKELQLFCFTEMNDGSTFCTDRNCRVNHRGAAEKVTVLPNQVFIRSTKNRAFKDPSVSSDKWSDDFLKTVVDKLETMDHWLYFFRIIRNITDQEPSAEINSDRYQNEQSFSDTIDQLQSVRKRKREQGLVMELISYSLGTDFNIKPDTGYSIESLAKALATIDKTLHALINNYKSIHQEHSDLENFVKPALTQGEELIKLLANKVGAKPKYLNAHFDAPSLWSTIGLMSAELVNMSNKLFNHMSTNDEYVSKMANRAAVSYAEPLLQSLGERIEKLSKSIRILNDTVESIIEDQEPDSAGESHRHSKKRATNPSYHVGDDYSSSSSSTDSNYSDGSLIGEGNDFRRPRASNVSTTSQSLTNRPSHMQSTIDDRLTKMEKDLQSLKALKEGIAVNFCSLGFKSLNESNVWLTQHSPGKEFGLVVDVHIVMEHLYALIFGKDSTLSNLHNLARIKLKTDIEGIAVTSFEQSVPKLFSKASFKVVRNDTSYFDTIMSYGDWSTTDDGYRDIIVDRLKEFKEDHEALILQQLDISSPMYTVAFNSLTVSVAWIEELIRYIDSTYKEYTESKFSSKKAWSITTRLAKTLLTSIDKPRSGIVRSLRTKKPLLMKQSIFYSTIRSIDEMQKLSLGGLKNSPVVANELVKFLAKNTNVDAIDSLNTEVSNLREENKKLKSLVSELSTKVTEAVKNINNCNNSVANHKNLIGGLDKRIQKLE